MAAPTHTARTTAAALAAAGGVQLPRGFSSVMVFNRLPNAFFWPIKAKPGKISGGEPIKQTTMLNAAVHTFAFQALVEHGDVELECAYDPYLRTQIEASLVNQNGSCTFYWGDQSYMDFFGGIYEAEFSDLADNELPMVTLKIKKTNYDPVNKLEVAPVIVSVTGT